MKKNGGPLTQPSPLPEWLSMIERVYIVLEVMLDQRQNSLEFCNKLLQKANENLINTFISESKVIPPT